MNAFKARVSIEQIAIALRSGAIDYKTAVSLANPHLAIMQTKADEIARKNGKRPIKITLTKLFR
jgi:hypothetical protein